MPTKQDFSSQRPNVPSVADTMLSEPVVSMPAIELTIERFRSALRELVVDIQPPIPHPSEENPYVIKLTKAHLDIVVEALRQIREHEQEIALSKLTSYQARLVNLISRERMNIWVVLSGLTDIELL